jgi:hypothetical protein
VAGKTSGKLWNEAARASRQNPSFAPSNRGETKEEIDFCLNRHAPNLGQVRQALRPWVKRGVSNQNPDAAKLPAFTEPLSLSLRTEKYT